MISPALVARPPRHLVEAEDRHLRVVLHPQERRREFGGRGPLVGHPAGWGRLSLLVVLVPLHYRVVQSLDGAASVVLIGTAALMAAVSSSIAVATGKASGSL